MFGETGAVENVSLIDRAEEKRTLRLLLKAATDGFSGSLVLRGEPGIGKTALLDYAVAEASGMQVARLAAVEAETAVGFAALHQLLIPFLPEMDVLPEPQREALRSAFGMTVAEAGAPDRFLVGLAHTDAAGGPHLAAAAAGSRGRRTVAGSVLGRGAGLRRAPGTRRQHRSAFRGA